MSDVVVYDSGEQDEPRVLIRDRGSYGLIVLESRGRSMAVLPSVAAELASGIDAVLARISRDGRVRRPA